MTDTASGLDDHYQDNGCRYNPVPLGCLNCPFPVCWHDDPKAFGKGWATSLAISKLAKQGTHYLQIAEEMNLTPRSVLRHLAKHRGKEGSREPFSEGSLKGAPDVAEKRRLGL
jgi:hypothetical protein